ncbi:MULTISPECIES: nuclear transport factor 2 family protein [Rhizobium]|uniref:nuclear transport factor 2 family protein n=1 Tax=Rhizobium TaxID=379 RepID=UPI001FD8910F|nr:nuclear transport factor 2 family protein [Rhizobium anhuiense]
MLNRNPADPGNIDGCFRTAALDRTRRSGGEQSACRIAFDEDTVNPVPTGRRARNSQVLQRSSALPHANQVKGILKMSPKEIVLSAVVALFTNFDPEAASQLLKENYIQHNPAVPTGAAPILGFLPALKQSGLTATTHRVLAEGDLVVLHSTYENAQAFGGQTMVAFDVFRVEDGKVAEHWDNLQAAVPASKTASGNSMTDGATEIKDLAKTAENRTLVENFVHDVLLGTAPQKITDYISTETYIQHNPMVGNGLDGLGAALKAMAEAGQPMAYTKTHLIVAEGNFVFTASEGKLGETPTAFFDLFRVESGKIVEHWDTISTIPAQMAHDNGKF